MSVGGDGTARRIDWGLGAGAGGWAAPSAEALAESIPGLSVRALAGRGGMGAVYRAEQTRLGRSVAVKVLAPLAGAGTDPLAEERFEREARVLAGLSHPHVLQVYDAGRLADGTRYLVTEWAEGGDLARLAAGRPQPAALVADWVGQIAAALDAAHARGIVHRDLKPANVLVRADGRLALADFGLARAQGAGFTTALTLSGVAYGTADYMAPEQMGGPGAGAISPATDVYALGVMTYQLLTGRTPRGAFDPVSRAARAPAAVDAVILAALANEPERRTQTAGEFARALAKALGGGGRKKGGRGLVVGAVAALGVIGAAAWFMPRGTRGTDSVTAEARAAEPAMISKAEPVAAAKEPERAVEAKATPPARAEKRNLLPALDLDSAEKRGGWRRAGDELMSDGAVCWIALPERVPEDFRYELVVEFTRKTGRHSVGVFLPTAAGTGVFELDAWEAGVGGLQMIDGRDIRANGSAFSAALRNGERQQVHLVVDGTTVSIVWNGVLRGTVQLAGRRFENNWMWDAGGSAGLGLCSWQSTTVFHRVDYRAR